MAPKKPKVAWIELWTPEDAQIVFEAAEKVLKSPIRIIEWDDIRYKVDAECFGSSSGRVIECLESDREALDKLIDSFDTPKNRKAREKEVEGAFDGSASGWLVPMRTTTDMPIRKRGKE